MVVTSGLSAAGAATAVVWSSDGTDVSKSLISLFSPNLDPVTSFGSDAVPISPVSRIADP